MEYIYNKKNNAIIYLYYVLIKGTVLVYYTNYPIFSSFMN